MPRRANKKNKKNKTKNRKKATNSGLGRAIKNKWGGKPDRENHASGRVKRKDHIIQQQFASNQMNTDSNKFKSITEVSNIQEFVDTLNAQKKIKELESNEEMKLISNDPTESIENKEIQFHQKLNEAELFNYENLPIPRKPKWDKTTSVKQLKLDQETAFLNWRRGLANTAKQTHLEMTPFEKNIQVWKELWRVVERSNILILIVDARNPLAFISRDLFKYVNEVDNTKRCMLMINKADYLNALQRKYWREYFKSQDIEILYFSAMREQIRFDLMTKSHRDKISDKQSNKIIENIDTDNDRVLNVEELIDIFLSFKASLNLDKIEIGMIGYPNVGKSSIINVLMGSKKVSIGSTPGKTKHFQTLNLRENIILCDCPGLVFPTLMSSKSDMILNGVISIDNLTDFITPSRLMAHRVKINKFNDCYNLKLPVNKKSIKFITVYDILDSYCHQKKMYNKSKVPKRNEAARIMLKDYVKGKIIYNHYPPNLNSRNKYLFYHGKLINDNNNNNKNKQCQNVLDQTKLNRINEDEEEDEEDEEDEEEEEEEEENELDLNMDKITDEEFLTLWKHPMEDYGGTLGGSKKKHEKKARVMRRIEKKTSKQNRTFRRDADNFQHGSNAVVVSAVPQIKAKHQPLLL